MTRDRRHIEAKGNRQVLGTIPVLMRGRFTIAKERRVQLSHDASVHRGTDCIGEAEPHPPGEQTIDAARCPQIIV